MLNRHTLLLNDCCCRAIRPLDDLNASKWYQKCLRIAIASPLDDYNPIMLVFRLANSMSKSVISSGHNVSFSGCSIDRPYGCNQ
jgi:hypothetical protein